MIKKEEANITSIIINLNSYQYNLISKIISTYNLNRKDNISSKFDFNNEIKNIKKEQEIITSTLKNIFDMFPIFKKYKVNLVLTGSFARGTNRFDSDLDLHFIYQNKYKKILFTYEELYIYAISTVLSINRTRIHSVITTKLNPKNLTKINKNPNNLKITLKYETWEVSYEYQANTKKRFYLEYLNKKDLTSFFTYLKKEVKGLNREWAHNFLCLSNSKNFTKKYSQLLKYEKKYLNKTALNNLISSLLIKLDNPEKTENLKKIYQINIYYLIYNTLELIRLKLILDGENIPYFNLISFYNNKSFQKYISKKDFEYIYYYLYLIHKLSYKITQNNEIFSSHVNNNLNKYLDDEIIRAYNNIQNNIKKILLNIRSDLNV